MNRDITTVDDVFDALGGVTSVARSLEVNVSTASEMKRRRSIPSHHWIELALTEPVEGWPGVTLEILAKVHTAEVARKRLAKTAEAQA
jgi:hypothetical protein